MTEDIEKLKSEVYWYKLAYSTLVQATKELAEVGIAVKIMSLHLELYDAELKKVEDGLD